MHDDTANRSADEKAIHELYERLKDGWNRGSGEGFASIFAEDGEQIAFDGTHFRDRDEIATSHQELFDRFLKGTRLVGGIENVKFIHTDVAVAYAVGNTIMRGKSKPSPERESVQTLVAVRRDGEWKLAALDNIRRRPIGNGFGSFLAWTIADLAWKLLGAGRRA